MNILRNIKNNLHIYMLWILASLLLWGFILVNITTPSQDKRVTIFINSYACETERIEEKLNENKPSNLRKIFVHEFTYASFASNSIEDGDIYIIKESEYTKYSPDFIALNNDFVSSHSTYDYYSDSNGTDFGIKVYDKTTHKGIFKDYIQYTYPEDGVYEEENYFLFFNKKSIHIGNLNDSSSNSAITIVEQMLDM